MPCHGCCPLGPVVHSQGSRSLLAPLALMDEGEAAGVQSGTGSGTGSGTWQLGHEYRVGLSQEAQGTCLKKGANPQLSPHRKEMGS